MKAEIRKDYIINRYVIIAPGRKKRPHQYKENISLNNVASPFTREKLKETKTKIFDSLSSGKRKIIAIPNLYPAITPNNKRAYGFQEVIVETPDPKKRLADLNAIDIKNLLKMYQLRTKALLSKKKINYVLCFKNEGLEAGASIFHAHSQIFATEIVPPRVVETRERLSEYKIEHGKSLYKDVFTKEMKTSRRVFEDKSIAVFCPYASAYENEVWIVTKKEHTELTKLKDEELSSMAKALWKILQPLKKMKAPYNYFIHSLKGIGAEHLCLRIEPRAHIWSGVELDSSMTVNWVAPEEAAKMYRKAFKIKVS